MPTASHSEGEKPLTVRRLLAEELFTDTLLGGAGPGLEATVEWCVPGPTPRGAGAPDRDLRATAVFVALADLAADLEVINRWAERGVAAVLAWSGDEAPVPHLLEKVAAAADRAELPLLHLPPRVTFRRASQLIATKVLAQSTHELEYGVRVHRILGDVFARGAGLGALAQSMAQLSRADVLVVGNSGEPLAHAAQPDSQLSGSLIEQLIAQLEGGGHLGAAVPAPRVVEVTVGSLQRCVVVTRIAVAGQTYGTLILVERQWPPAEHDLAQHVVMAEHGVTLTGSELLRQQSVREAEERARNDFVHALLHGRFTDQFELAARAEHYRFPLDGRFAVFIITSADLRLDDEAGRRRAADAAEHTRRVDADGALSLSALIGSMIVVVHQVDRDQTGAVEEPRWLRGFAERLHRVAGKRLGDNVRVAYGRAADGARGVARSYREARTAEALSKRVGAATVSSYDDLRVFAALQEVARSAAGQAFAREVLGPLQHVDGQTGNLEAVVLAYIAESGNLNATARRLHLHRNTMLYKLERASRALSMDLRSTEALFMVWLAHHITVLNEVTTRLDQELNPPT